MKSFQNLSRLNFEGNSVICTLQKKSLKRKGLPSRGFTSHSNLRLVNIIKGNNHFCFVQFCPFMSCKCSFVHYWFMSTAYQVINWSYSFTKHQPTLFTSLHNVPNLIETFFPPSKCIMYNTMGIYWCTQVCSKCTSHSILQYIISLLGRYSMSGFTLWSVFQFQVFYITLYNNSLY